MAGEPKRRHSRARKGKRRASISLSIPNAVVCANCGNMIIAHAVCKNCGFYKGKEVINKTPKTTEVTA
ncbi:MAG: 50S ribosomal protein L32 [Patescibacteria group bacterium]